MNMAQKETVIQFFKAVGQAERLRILGLLANNSYTVATLAKEMRMKETAVSRHLHILQKADLIQQQKDTYQLKPSKLTQMQQIIDGESTPSTLETDILNQYVQDEQLTAIPQKQAEREIILHWLTQKFDPERRYTEEEVTAIVARHYRYPLTLRRILADNQFLMHTGRHYWRPLPRNIPFS